MENLQNPAHQEEYVYAGAMPALLARAAPSALPSIEPESLSALLDLAPDAFIIVDSRGVLVQRNTQVETLFGYRREELVGQTLEQLLPGRRSQVPGKGHELDSWQQEKVRQIEQAAWQLARLTEDLRDVSRVRAGQFSTSPGHMPLVEICVTDQGIGIPQERLAAIFERFTRGDMSLTRETGGLGMGLTICQHIAELHQGYIWAESTQRRGSAFHLVLPAGSTDTR